MKQTIFAAALLIAMMSVQIASARTPYINKRQCAQHHRIQQGVRNGSLTHREAAHLKMQQAHIRHDKMLAMADGHVSPRERAIINREQNKADRNIYRQKHDVQYRRR